MCCKAFRLGEEATSALSRCILPAIANTVQWPVGLHITPHGRFIRETDGLNGPWHCESLLAGCESGRAVSFWWVHLPQGNAPDQDQRPFRLELLVGE